MFDPVLRPVLAGPSSFEKMCLVGQMAGLKRTLPEPGKDAILDSLAAFKATVERESPYSFDWTNVSRKIVGSFPNHERKPGTWWSISGHSSRTYTQLLGGKTGETREVILEFFKCPVSHLFPTCPEKDVYDITGNLVLRVEDWDPEIALWQILYPKIVEDPEGSLDERLGLMGLLWSIWHLKMTGQITIEIEEEFLDTCTSYKPNGFKVTFLHGAILTRISPQPEEGWKVRVITITDLSAAIIGMAARHILDPVIWSVPSIRIGLLNRVKLFDVMESIGGQKSAVWDRDRTKLMFSPIPDHAESVDLTTATDTPFRQQIRQVLTGMLDGLNHPFDNFLRFAVDIATCDRLFQLERGYPDETFLPRSHNSGIMMGEGLSGIYLNMNSVIVRSLAGPLMRTFGPRVPGMVMTNDETDRWIRKHEEELIAFLQSASPFAQPYGSNSGDDVIQFSTESQSNAFRILYRMSGCVPSSTTWYSSTQFAIFCEEMAFRTYDSKGWKFADLIKLRAFQSNVSDKDGKVLISKIRLISSYMRYFSKDDPRIPICITIVNKLISKDKAWNRVIQRLNPPLGFPQFLGGIDHPIQYDPSYVLSLDLRCLSILKGMEEIDPLEAFSLCWMDSEESLNERDSEFIKQLLSDVSEIPILSQFEESVAAGFNISTCLPINEGERWWAYQQRVDKFKKDHSLISLFDTVKKFSDSIRLKYELEGTKEEVKAKKAYRIIANRFVALVKRFPPKLDDFSSVSVWKIRERAFEKARMTVYPEEFLKTYTNLYLLPTMSIRILA